MKIFLTGDYKDGLVTKKRKTVKREPVDEVHEVDVQIPSFGNDIEDEIRIFTIGKENDKIRIVIPPNCEIKISDIDGHGSSMLVQGSPDIQHVDLSRKKK